MMFLDNEIQNLSLLEKESALSLSMRLSTLDLLDGCEWCKGLFLLVEMSEIW